MEADAGLVRTPESVRGPDPEEGARARAEFAALHGPALRASGVPERYWGRLLYKLEHEVRAGATQGGGPGAVLGPPPAQAGARSAGPGRAGGGPLSTLLLGRARSRAGLRPRTAGVQLRGGRAGSAWGRHGGLEDTCRWWGGESGISRCECALQGGELVSSWAGLGETLRGVRLGQLTVVG